MNIERKTDWNEKLGQIEEIWIIIQKVRQPSEELKIITDQQGKMRKLCREDFSLKQWNEIEEGGKILLPVLKVLGRPRIFPPKFPEIFSLEKLHPGDMAFWCGECGFYTVKTFQDNFSGKIESIINEHQQHKADCDGILTEKMHVFNHEGLENKMANSLLAAMAKSATAV